MSDSQNRYTRLFLFQCEFFVSFTITQATPTSLTSSHSALFTDRQPTRKLCDMSYCYGRWYGKKDKYRLPIDEEETDRLDIFHKFFRVARHGRLFSASLDMTEPLQVLDLGTGTGIWATQLADEYPHISVQGLDLHMIQSRMIPSNMKPPKLFDLEDSWDAIGLGWDFIHARTLFGSIESWPDMYQKMITHLKPGGYIEHIEIDWDPQCDDRSLPPNSSLSQWAKKLLDAMDRYGRPMKVDSKETQRQLGVAGFTNISETVIKAYCNDWPEDSHDKEVGNWFNFGFSIGLAALSYAAMVETLRMSKEEVESLCNEVKSEICTRSYHAYCTM
ncbi:S-adenosyl-L-methionine-dependent methyltransferase [Ilyonectria sp. MPI-CAGE-AT-0026]|nr:S-adenosyl-L-methionine-dependent methyltransferase [Ilyonectria sp. MPI-CAGE-AT-0026]